MKKIEESYNNFPIGATSLLVVTGLALVFIVIITGLTTLSIRQSQQALNTDLSSRALAAAESAAQDAAQRLNINPNEEYPSCTDITRSTFVGDTTSFNNAVKPILSTSADNTTSVVCRTVSISSTQPSGQIKKDDSVQIFTYLPSGTSINQMELEWGKENAVVQDSVAMYPELVNWPAGAPAVIELSVVSWPKTGLVSSDNLSIDTRMVVPTSIPNDSSPKLLSGTFISPKTCTSTLPVSGYNCKTTIDLDKMVPGTTGAVNRNIVVRLRARYKDADYQAKFFNKPSLSSPVAVKSSRALIDVTAKVGDLYRRIQAEKPLANNSFINDVLYSGASICKTLTVKPDYSLIDPNNCN